MNTATEHDTDWCGYCDATTVYDGERCTGCGRLWGYDKPGDELLAKGAANG